METFPNGRRPMPRLPPDLQKVAIHDDLIDTPPPVLAVTVNEAIRIAGIGKTLLYEEMAAGRIDAVKAGARTLILMDSLRAYIAGLPRFGKSAA